MNSVRELYYARDLPIFQNRMYACEAEARACPVVDVRLVEDLASGLVYNAAFEPERLVYDEHYQNEQAVSTQFRIHLEAVADIVERELGTRSLVEVACGKGYFLEMLAGRNIEITGFDPAYEGANPNIARRYFTPEEGVRGEGLILRHVLEHIADPVVFLEHLRDANLGRGKIYIEVPCFEWICERRAWFDIFYEHVNYFRLTDFRRMFGVVYQCGHLFGGQYIYVVADLASLRTPHYEECERVQLPANGMHARAGIPAKSAVIWGGASKGVIFALQCMREGVPVAAVIDINPAKQGKYLPVTGLKVEAPLDVLPRLPAGTTIYVMNSNYLDEIRASAGDSFNYAVVEQ